MKIVACIEYDGSRFFGWQVQKDRVSVQSEVESAFSEIANHKVSVHCAGRTDAGVHACGQIVHFETEQVRQDSSWVIGTNSLLATGVSILWSCQVDDSFHARFSAISRRYRYVILNRRSRPSYLVKRVGWYPKRLDASKMADAATLLTGTHDYSAFRSSQCGNKNPVKTVYELNVSQSGDWIWIDVEASGFLHHMVRNIVGVLSYVGDGRQEVEWAKHVLDSRDRTVAGVTVPADGLYFVSASYPEQYCLPAPALPCRFW